MSSLIDFLIGLFSFFVAAFILRTIFEMFEGVKMDGIGPIKNPFERKNTYRPLLGSRDWMREQGRIRITRRNPDAVDNVSVSLYSGRRDVVNWDWDNIISVEDDDSGR